jgi:phosphate starvation-inducible PhoH-like protein
MGKRSSHGALGLRLAETGSAGIVATWSPPAGHARAREQGYRRRVRPQSDGQRQLMAAIEHHHLTIALGPAGTGKTYLAVSAAVAAFEAEEVGRIVLTRPAVEAGERLGYLPGNIGEKLAPYLRPLNDALNERLGGQRVKQLMTEGAIEIAPIAYMRGRPLNNAFIVIDEAQNCTYGQIKMMLTRLGWHSTMVVTGDPRSERSPRRSFRARRDCPPARPDCRYRRGTVGRQRHRPPPACRRHADGAVRRAALGPARRRGRAWFLVPIAEHPFPPLDRR